MKAAELVLEKPADYQAKTLDYDALWKNVIEKLFKEFMEFFAPDLHKQIDFSRPPDFLKQELSEILIEEKKGTRITDEIVKVFLKSGEEKWILIHIEVQGNADEDFGKRMFQYFYRIYDRFNQEIYVIALGTDQTAKQSNQFHYSLHGTKVEYTYNVYQFEEEIIPELERSSNPFAAADIAGLYANKSKKDANLRYAFKRRLMIQVLQNFSQQNEDIRTYLSALIYFIDCLLHVPVDLTKKLVDDITPYLGKEVVQEMQAEKENPTQTLAAIFAELKKEGKEEGMEQGEKRGEKKALHQIAQKLFRKGYSNEEVADLTELSLDEVKKWRRAFQEK